MKATKIKLSALNTYLQLKRRGEVTGSALAVIDTIIQDLKYLVQK